MSSKTMLMVNGMAWTNTTMIALSFLPTSQLMSSPSKIDLSTGMTPDMEQPIGQ